MKKQILIAVIAGLIVGTLVWAWSEPTVAPPLGNVYAPLNTGPTAQSKAGGLLLNTGGSANGLIVASGDVGIGATNPDSELHINSTGSTELTISGAGSGYHNGALVLKASYSANRAGLGMYMHDAGGDNEWFIGRPYSTSDSLIFARRSTAAHSTATASASGAIMQIVQQSGKWVLDMKNNKIANVSEIDPVFNVDGVKYVSYLPDSIGQKIEVVGQTEVNGHLIINLDKEPVGSDLWLFWKAVDKESVIPFVSAQGDFNAYSYLDGDEFTIHSDGMVSYRLIGTRIDHKGEDNLYSDQSVEYYIDLDQYK